MDPHRFHQVLIDPPPSSSSNTSFPILAISILGILTTAILLLSYYVFVIKCCLNWHHSDVIGRLSRSWRWRHTDDHPISSVYSTDISDRGLEESVIQQIPTFRFREGENNSFHECAVCLNEFQEDERIRLLPNCFHVFHIDCIDTWLQTHANCPLCRSDITNPSQNPIQITHPNLNSGESVVIEVRDEGSDRTPRTEASSNTSSTNPCVGKKERKLHKVSSMGDECIDVRGKDKEFSVQPMRRSFSMNSSSDHRQLYMAVQEILHQNPHFQEVGSGEGCSSGSWRNRRSIFSFGNCRSSKNAVLPNSK